MKIVKIVTLSLKSPPRNYNFMFILSILSRSDPSETEGRPAYPHIPLFYKFPIYHLTKFQAFYIKNFLEHMIDELVKSLL